MWQRRWHIQTRHANPMIRHAIVDVEAFGRAKIVATIDPRGKHDVRDHTLALEQTFGNERGIRRAINDFVRVLFG